MNGARFSIDLFLLGRFEVHGPNGPINLPSKKLRALLAYLACASGQVHTRETLMTLLWGSRLEARARQSLRQALTRLRRVLGENALISNGDTISLRSGAVACDVSRFELLARKHNHEAIFEATEIYKDQFLANLAIPEEGWTEWLRTERQRLEDIAVDALIRLAEQQLELRHAKDAFASAKRAIAINGLREDAHRLAIRATAATGNRGLALKHFDELVNFLRRELNVGPDISTLALAAELRLPQPQSRLDEPRSVPMTKSRRTSLQHRPNMDWHPPCRLIKWHG